MTKLCADEVLDEGLEYIQTNCNSMIACSGAPADYASVSGVALADVSMSSGDFSIADGSGGETGRTLTVAAKSSVTIDTSDTATHIVLVDTSGMLLLYVTTCDSLYLTAAQTVDFPSWDITLRDPT